MLTIEKILYPSAPIVFGATAFVFSRSLGNDLNVSFTWGVATVIGTVFMMLALFVTENFINNLDKNSFQLEAESHGWNFEDELTEKCNIRDFLDNHHGDVSTTELFKHFGKDHGAFSKDNFKNSLRILGSYEYFRFCQGDNGNWFAISQLDDGSERCHRVQTEIFHKWGKDSRKIAWLKLFKGE